MAELKKSGKLKDRVILAAASSSNVRTDPATDSTVVSTVKLDKVAGTGTGYLSEQSDGQWYEIYLATPTDTQDKGFIRSDVAKVLSESESKKLNNQGKDLIDKLVLSDVEVFHSLVRNSNLLNEYIKKDYSVKDLQARHDKLLSRLSKRQEKLKTSRALKTKTGFKKGFKNAIQAYKLYLQTFYGIGVIPVAAVVIGAVIGVGLSITVYLLFRADYTESTEDLKVSKELETALKNLDPTTYNKVVTDLEGQVDTAYAKGKTAGKFSGTMGTLKMLGMFALGIWAVDIFEKYRKHR